jgi:hypothetical protein
VQAAENKCGKDQTCADNRANGRSVDTGDKPEPKISAAGGFLL